MVELPVKKLARLCNPFVTPPWGTGKVTKAMVHKAIEKGTLKIASVPVPVDSIPEIHAHRIAFLVEHPAIDPIEVDVGVPDLGYIPDWIVIDGNHRLGAAIIMGKETIPACVSGDIDYGYRLFGVSI